MHGLILRTIQLFLQETYGSEQWECIAARASIDPPEFEAMLHYETRMLGALLGMASDTLGKPEETLLEDVGTYLISHPSCAGVRRL